MENIKRYAFVFFLFYAILSIQQIYANEVPEDRTISIFAPFYFELGDTGESTLKALIYFYHNYKIVSEYIEYIPPTPSPVETSLTGLLSQLEADTGSGILMINSHGDTGGWLAVEAYEYTENGYNALLVNRNDYINTGIPSSEINTGEEKDKYYALLISADYIKNHTSRMCNKSIVFGSFCYSLDFADAFIGGGKVYNYFGYPCETNCVISKHHFEKMINRMGGALDEKRNYTVSEARKDRTIILQVLSGTVTTMKGISVPTENTNSDSRYRTDLEMKYPKA